MCVSVGFVKKPKLPLEKVSTAKDFVDMTSVKRKEGIPFSKLERALPISLDFLFLSFGLEPAIDGGRHSGCIH